MISITPMYFSPGALYGLRSSSLLIKINSTFSDLSQSQCLTNASTILMDHIKPLNISPETYDGINSSIESTDSFLAFWMDKVFEASNYPVFERARVIDRSDRVQILALPVFNKNIPAVTMLLRCLSDLLNSSQKSEPKTSWAEGFSQAFRKLKEAGVQGSNTPRFLRAAFAGNIPYMVVAGRVMQYGQGSKSRWMDSSFTDRTPNLSTYLARNKDLASQVLKQAGLPVPRHNLVNSEALALSAAEKIGYPVVIKPADKDGGQAVFAGLQTPTEVQIAFQTARKTSSNVLLEKHITGRDYRINVFDKRVLWAIERVPAGITGDGESSIIDLIAKLNADPRRGTGIHAPLKKITLDEEALATLRANNLTPEQVPALGSFVPLRRRANIASGGMPISVMDKVHPDNAALALSAAEALGLDIAGVDLLLPDISQSWKVTGGVICEVNAQPQLGGVTSLHVYAEILDTMIEGNGRIPTILVLGRGNNDLIQSISAMLRDIQFTVGFTTESGLFINNEQVNSDTNTFRSGQLLARNRNISAIVLSVSETDFIKTGLPFDQFDLLIIAGESPELSGVSEDTTYSTAVHQMISLLVQHCRNSIWIAKDHGFPLLREALSQDIDSIYQTADQNDWIGQIVRRIQQIDQHHSEKRKADNRL